MLYFLSVRDFSSYSSLLILHCRILIERALQRQIRWEETRWVRDWNRKCAEPSKVDQRRVTIKLLSNKECCAASPSASPHFLPLIVLSNYSSTFTFDTRFFHLCPSVTKVIPSLNSDDCLWRRRFQLKNRDTKQAMRVSESLSQKLKKETIRETIRERK